MKRYCFILLLISCSVVSFAKNKERITEQGSSLFYRSWRYPVMNEGKEEQQDTLSVDTLTIESPLGKDTLAADSMPTLSSNATPIAQSNGTTHNSPTDSSTFDNSNNDNKIASSTENQTSENNENEKTSLVERPDINTCIVYFIFDQDNFITDYTSEFDTIMSFIDYHKGKNFDVIGHTDERGTVAYNQKLSERRSLKVYNVLLRRGVDAKRLRMIGRSELELAIPHTKNEKEHQLNRRVEIKVRKEE